MNYPPPPHNMLQQNPIMINLTTSDDPEFISKQEAKLPIYKRTGPLFFAS